MRHTTDKTVTVDSWSMVYYVSCQHTGNMWSRNRWGTSDSIPDLYGTYNAAYKQVLTTGKAHLCRGTRGPVVRKMMLGYNST